MATEEALLDRLIDEVEEIIEDGEACFFSSSPEASPRSCAVRRISENYLNSQDRRSVAAKLFHLREGYALLQLKENIIKGQEVELTHRLGKTGTGEYVCIAAGKVIEQQRILGGYEIKLALARLERAVSPTADRFLDCAVKGDFAGWNRWCSDLTEG
ncbi:MAG: hypothetical protein ACYTGH_22185, partial [Planctomycetota bacterium]